MNPTTPTPDSRPAGGARAPFHAAAQIKSEGNILAATGTEAEVCADIARRQAHGVAKYGQTVAENPLLPPAWLQHLYEELLDGAVYAKRLLPLLTAMVADQEHHQKLLSLLLPWAKEGESAVAALTRLASEKDAAEALCAELRDAGDRMYGELPHDSDGDAARATWRAALAKTPADMGAEIKRLRGSRDGLATKCGHMENQWRADAQTITDLRQQLAEREDANVRAAGLSGDLAVLRQQLAERDAELECAKHDDAINRKLWAAAQSEADALRARVADAEEERDEAIKDRQRSQLTQAEAENKAEAAEARNERLVAALRDCESDLACYEGNPKYPGKNQTLKGVRAALADNDGAMQSKEGQPS